MNNDSLKFFDLEGDQYKDMDELVGYAKEFFIKKPTYKIILQDTKEVIYESYIDMKNLSNDAIQRLGELIDNGISYDVQTVEGEFAGESDVYINTEIDTVNLTIDGKSMILSDDSELIQKLKGKKINLTLG